MPRRRWRRVTTLHFGTGNTTRSFIQSLDQRRAEAPTIDLSAESLLPHLPRAVETFGRRFLAIGLQTCAPPVSNSLRVKLRGTRRTVRSEIIAVDREAYSRMVMAPLTGALLGDVARWAWGFASSFRIEHNRRGHVRIRVAVTVNPDEHASGGLRWRPGSGSTHDKCSARDDQSHGRARSGVADAEELE